MTRAVSFFGGRMIGALLAAPLATVMLMVLWFIALGPVNPADSTFRGIVAVATATAVYAYPALLLGLPLLYLFWTKGVQKWEWYWLAGGLLGFVYSLVLAGGGLLSLPSSIGELGKFLWYAFCGLSSSALFRAIYRPNEKSCDR